MRLAGDEQKATSEPWGSPAARAPQTCAGWSSALLPQAPAWSWPKFMWVLGFVSMKLSGICLPHLEFAAFMLERSYWKSPKRCLFLRVIKTITVGLLIPEHSNKLTAKIEESGNNISRTSMGAVRGCVCPERAFPSEQQLHGSPSRSDLAVMHHQLKARSCLLIITHRH